MSTPRITVRGGRTQREALRSLFLTNSVADSLVRRVALKRDLKKQVVAARRRALFKQVMTVPESV